MSESGVNRKVRIGWVGSGFIGQVAHPANYAEMIKAEVVALAEPRPKPGAEVGRRH